MTRFNFCAIFGSIGGMIAYLLGGWDDAMVTLVILMSIDYIAGLVVAGVFHKSKKTPHGGLESKAGWKGICRKIMTLCLVAIANRLDITLGCSYLRDTVTVAFCVEELISITENASLMGVPIPKGIQDALEMLKKKSNMNH